MLRTNLKLEVFYSCSDGGSDSSVSDGPPVHMQFQAQRVSHVTNFSSNQNIAFIIRCAFG